MRARPITERLPVFVRGSLHIIFVVVWSVALGAHPAPEALAEPLLIGKYAGDIAQVQAPGGSREYEIIDVRYE